jgi:hypothetical protein
MLYTPEQIKISKMHPLPSQFRKTPQIHMQLRHPERNMPQTIIRLSSESYVSKVVFYGGETDAEVGEAFDGGEVQDVVEEGRDVAGEVGDGFGGDPGEDVLEGVVLADEEVAGGCVSGGIRIWGNEGRGGIQLREFEDAGKGGRKGGLTMYYHLT